MKAAANSASRDCTQRFEVTPVAAVPETENPGSGSSVVSDFRRPNSYSPTRIAASVHPARPVRPTGISSRRDVFEILAVDGDHPLSHPFDVFIMSLIAVNVVVVMLATVGPLYRAHAPFFRAFEVVSVAVFTVEYVARVWTCTFDEDYTDPVFGRLRFARRPFLLVDLLAILPFYLSGLFIDLRFLRSLRLLRFFRLLKFARYSESMRRFGYVIREKREDLTIAVAATVILLLVSSSLMYFAERGAQPDAFSSIPAALWWGVVTLTTVGYGDVYPITPLGRLLGAVIAILGVGLVALPASILASGFVEEEERAGGVCPHCGSFVEELDDEREG